MFTWGSGQFQPLLKWGWGGHWLTQASGMTAIFCKLICGLAKGKHHRLQMLKSFQVQRGGKANPEPGTVATERSDADSSAASALVCGGTEMTGRPHCSGASGTLQPLESHSGE